MLNNCEHNCPHVVGGRSVDRLADRLAQASLNDHDPASLIQAAALLCRKLPDPPGVAYEGLPAGSVRVERPKLCDGVLKALDDHKLVVVKAPPCSGKTSLSHLLCSSEIPKNTFVIRITLASDSPSASQLKQLGLTWDTLTSGAEAMAESGNRVVLIADEAQRRYELDDTLWEKIKDGTPVQLLLLALYSSNITAASPVSLRSAHTITLFSSSQQPLCLVMDGKEQALLFDAWDRAHRRSTATDVREYIAFLCGANPVCSFVFGWRMLILVLHVMWLVCGVICRVIWCRFWMSS